MVRPTGLEPVTYGLAYHYGFRRHCVRANAFVALKLKAHNVWGLDYIFTISGGTRIVSTDPVYSKPTAVAIKLRPFGILPVSSVLP